MDFSLIDDKTKTTIFIVKNSTFPQLILLSQFFSCLGLSLIENETYQY